MLILFQSSIGTFEKGKDLTTDLNVVQIGKVEAVLSW